MTREEFKKVLGEKGYKWREEGEWIVVESPTFINLNSLKSIPNKLKFNARDYVYLLSLKSIPDNVQFNNGDFVDLGSLKSIPDNFQFNNRGNVYLDSLKSMGDNVKFRNEGRVFLNSLKSIPINLDAEEIFQNRNDIKINGEWLDLEKNISFPYSRWKSVDTGKVQMYESWVKNNF